MKCPKNQKTREGGTTPAQVLVPRETGAIGGLAPHSGWPGKIQKSAIYNLNDYQVIIRSTKGLCVNSDLSQEKNKSLILILTECITNPNSNQLIRRPISSIITVKMQQESGLNSYSKISDFIKSF